MKRVKYDTYAPCPIFTFIALFKNDITNSSEKYVSTILLKSLTLTFTYDRSQGSSSKGEHSPNPGKKMSLLTIWLTMKPTSAVEYYVHQQR